MYIPPGFAAITHVLAAGAPLRMETGDMPYGDRQGSVVDPAGNTWWISQRLIHEPYF